MAAGLAACGLTADGAAYCWGFVNGRSVDQPTLVPGGLAFRSLGTNGFTFCGVASDEQAYCWGESLGTFWDPASGRRETPLAVPGSGGTLSLAVTNRGLCVTTAARELRCLGYIGTQTSPAYTLGVVGRGADHPLARLEGGSQHACGIDVVSGGWCWGLNTERQAGIGEDIFAQFPLQLRIP